MGFNLDEMTFAEASQAKAAPSPPRAMDSAELADQGGWLIGGWSQAVYNEGVFPFFGGGGLKVRQSLKLMLQLIMNFYIRRNGFLPQIVREKGN